MLPIPAKDFIKDSTSKSPKFKGNNQKEILNFLQSREGQAFSQYEIQRELSIEYSPSVNATLHSLHLRELVECKRINGKNYWCARPCQPTT